MSHQEVTVYTRGLWDGRVLVHSYWETDNDWWHPHYTIFDTSEGKPFPRSSRLDGATKTSGHAIFDGMHIEDCNHFADRYCPAP